MLLLVLENWMDAYSPFLKIRIAVLSESEIFQTSTSPKFLNSQKNVVFFFTLYFSGHVSFIYMTGGSRCVKKWWENSALSKSWVLISCCTEERFAFLIPRAFTGGWQLSAPFSTNLWVHTLLTKSFKNIIFGILSLPSSKHHQISLHGFSK